MNIQQMKEVIIINKVIDLTKPIKDIVQAHPEVISIMQQIGFESITNPIMLNTAGRVMTIEKGAKMKGIKLETIKEAFIQAGFTISES